MTTRHARLKATTATVCSAALLSACTTLPGDSSPEAVSSYSTTPAMEEVIQPTKGNPSDLMLRDFFAASAHPLADHEAARHRRGQLQVASTRRGICAGQNGNRLRRRRQ